MRADLALDPFGELLYRVPAEVAVGVVGDCERGDAEEPGRHLQFPGPQCFQPLAGGVKG